MQSIACFSAFSISFQHNVVPCVCLIYLRIPTTALAQVCQGHRASQVNLGLKEIR